MSRSRWLLATALTASVTLVGCAHCDTCDNFPVPCVGGDCGPGPGPMPTMGGPVMMGEPMIINGPAPALAPVISSPANQAPNGSGNSGDAAPLPPPASGGGAPFSPPPSGALPAPLMR